MIILMDLSESVLSHFDQELRTVEQLVSKSPWNPGDSLSVLTFGGMETHLICAVDCATSFPGKRILLTGGATPLFDAVESATTILNQHKKSEVWPVIILFSDGVDTISKVSLNGVLEKVLKSGAQIYAVDVSHSGRSSNCNETLQKLSSQAGGDCILLPDATGEVFQRVIEDLHSAQVVTYAPPKCNSAFHPIRILPTKSLKLQFRCRGGYYQPMASSSSEDHL